MTRDHRLGIVLMIGATVCWSSAGVLVRTMNLADPWEITFWRSVFMAVFVLAFMAVQYRADLLRRVVATGIPGLVSASLWALMYICFLTALTRTTVANTLVVSSVAPFLAAVFGWIFLREHVPVRTWVAILVAVSGIALMFADGLKAGSTSGDLIAAAIPVAFGLNVVLHRRMHAEVDMVPTVFLSGVLSCALTLPFALPFEASGLDFLNLGILGVVQLGLGCLLMVFAVRRLTAAEVGLISELEIVLGVAAAWALVGERPSGAALAGGFAVVGALTADTVLGRVQSGRTAPAIS